MTVTYEDRSANGKGWEDAKNKLGNRNPYALGTIFHELYEDGYQNFVTRRYEGEGKKGHSNRCVGI